jgi:hypothetical protein
MEDMTPGDSDLRNLQRRAKKLTSDSLSLANTLAKEANRLNRQDEASRLRVLYSSIRQQLKWATNLENAARNSHNERRLKTSLAGLAIEAGILMLSENRLALAFSDHILRNIGGKECSFGTVLVSVGPKGLPDDVQVVSISESARQSDRQELEVIEELRERGYLLFSEGAFSHLINSLVADIQEGRLTLPVLREKLAENQTSSSVKLETGRPKWVVLSEPPQKREPSS